MLVGSGCITFSSLRSGCSEWLVAERLSGGENYFIHSRYITLCIFVHRHNRRSCFFSLPETFHAWSVLFILHRDGDGGGGAGGGGGGRHESMFSTETLFIKSESLATYYLR